MEALYLYDRVVKKEDLAGKPPGAGEYEACTFQYCDFSNTDLSHAKFIDCIFNDCNLSLAKLTATILRDVTFNGCKLQGLRFEDCSKFGLSLNFSNCSLNHTSFYKTLLKNTTFKDCQLLETDFTGCDLTAAIFTNCDLNRAVFLNTTLEKADLRTSRNYILDPETNKIKKARFGLSQAAGLLHKFGIVIDPNC